MNLRNIILSLRKPLKKKRGCPPIKQHLCKYCRQTDPEEFYGNHKSTCKKCNYENIDPEKRREQKRKYRKKYPEKNREEHKRWKIKNPNYSKEYWIKTKNKKETNKNFANIGFNIDLNSNIERNILCQQEN